MFVILDSNALLCHFLPLAETNLVPLFTEADWLSLLWSIRSDSCQWQYLIYDMHCAWYSTMQWLCFCLIFDNIQISTNFSILLFLLYLFLPLCSVTTMTICDTCLYSFSIGIWCQWYDTMCWSMQWCETWWWYDDGILHSMLKSIKLIINLSMQWKYLLFSKCENGIWSYLANHLSLFGYITIQYKYRNTGLNVNIVYFFYWPINTVCGSWRGRNMAQKWLYQTNIMA